MEANDARSIATLGANFPGPAARLLLAFLVPSRCRDEFVGDLIEEAETVVLPAEGPKAARRWFWRQAIISASPLFGHYAKKEIGMNRTRWIVVALLLVVGPLMALDSGANIFRASAGAVTLVVFAFGIPAMAGLLSANIRVHTGAALTSSALLLAARLVSGVELRWYAMAWIFFVILAMNWVWEHRLQQP